MRRLGLAGALAAVWLTAGTPEARGQEAGRPMNTLTDLERAAGWRLLFDGRTTAGWRGYGQDHAPAGWQVVDGALTRVGPAGDLITTETFRNFELALEWMVAPGGNSGVFYRGVEGLPQLYPSAPEMQVLDDERHADGRSPLTSAGSNYGLYPAPRGVVKPAGEWNAVRIVVDGRRVEHWLNGVRVVAYELGGEEWQAKVAASKFSQWPAYGKAAQGVIGLQDHGDRVAYRDIRIRPLP
jgi:hypothetical protein